MFVRGPGSTYRIKHLTTFYIIIVIPQLILQFHRVGPMVFLRNTIILRFQSWSNIIHGGPTFSRVVQMLISVETYRICCFAGSSSSPILLLDPRIIIVKLYLVLTFILFLYNACVRIIQ